jgi:hypothetical protein
MESNFLSRTSRVFRLETIGREEAHGLPTLKCARVPAFSTVESGPALVVALFTTMEDAAMNEDHFNMEVRRLLKVTGVTSQRALEHAVQAAIASGRLKGTETLPPRIVLTVPELGIEHVVEEPISLE